MSAPTSPIIRPSRLLTVMAAVVAVVTLALASMVATAASARAQAGELTGSSVGQADPVLLIAQRSLDQISSVPLAGGPESVVAESVNDPQGVTRHGDTLFVSEQDGRVVSVPMGGGDVTEVATELSSPRGLVVAGDMLYIADSANNRVVSVPVGGGDMEIVAEGDLNSPRGLAVSGNALFIADRQNNRVVSVPLGGGETTEVAAFDMEIGYLAVSGDTLYASGMDGAVWSMPVAGGEPTEFVTGLAGIRGIAAYDGILYIGETGLQDVDDRVLAKPLDGGELTIVAEVEGINDLAIGAEPCTDWSCVPLLGSLFGSLG